uniref:Serpin domain-containing protein n=1 Tax=Phocoena sinus TaxID=42100 RepID=A0A8C9B7G4_PHOSS
MFLFSNHRDSSANLHLPKLQTGHHKVFSKGADLSGITEELPLKLSKAVHRAWLTVDEKGAEKEDTTSLGSLPRSHLHTFHFNRPFLLLIFFEEGSHGLLFMGRTMDPVAKSQSGEKRVVPPLYPRQPTHTVRCSGLLKKKGNYD